MVFLYSRGWRSKSSHDLTSRKWGGCIVVSGKGRECKAGGRRGGAGRRGEGVFVVESSRHDGSGDARPDHKHRLNATGGGKQALRHRDKLQSDVGQLLSGRDECLHLRARAYKHLVTTAVPEASVRPAG